MGLLKFQPFVSSNIFIFKDPDTQYEFQARTMGELMARIIGYRAQNNLEPIENLRDVIEHYLCTLSANLGSCREVKLKRGFVQYIKGGMALLKNYYYGDKNITSQEVAEKRAAQCAVCPYNINPEKGHFDKWADEQAEHSVGDKKTSLHEALHQCEACGCNLKCKVFYKPKVILSSQEKDMMKNVNCWQLNG